MQNQQLSAFQVGSLCPYFLYLVSSPIRVRFHYLRNMALSYHNTCIHFSLPRTSGIDTFCGHSSDPVWLILRVCYWIFSVAVLEPNENFIVQRCFKNKKEIKVCPNII